MLHKPQRQPICQLIWALLLLICGLVIFRVGLINYTNHISNKSPTRNPFVESSSYNLNKKRWNTNLYGKAILFVLENESFDSVHNNNQKPQSSSKGEKPSFSLFGQLEKDQPNNCFFRRLSLTKPDTYLARVLSFMTGSHPSLFEIGSRIPYPNSAIEDSILYQMNQSGLKTLGFVNDSWNAVYKDLFTSQEVLEEQDKTNNHQEGRYSKIVSKLKSNNFDFVIVSDVISNFKETSSKTAVEQIQEQLQTIFDAMDNDTIFLAISDGQHNSSSDNNLNSSDSSSSASSFIFAYTKGGFSSHSSFIDEIELEVVSTVDGKAHENKSETIEENRIAVTIASIFGVAIPFSSSGRIIFDIYPSKISEQQFQQRILQDAYINMMQQFTLLKKSNVENLKIREMAGKTEEARLKIPKQHFDRTQVTNLLQQIILSSEIMSKSLQNQPLPYGLPAIYLGLVFSGFGVIFLAILLEKVSKRYINNENDLNNTGDMQMIKDQAVIDQVASQGIRKLIQQIMYWVSVLDTSFMMLHRWILNKNESPEESYSSNLNCIFHLTIFAAVSLFTHQTLKKSLKTLIILLIIGAIYNSFSDLKSLMNTPFNPFIISLLSLGSAGFYFFLQTVILLNNSILPLLQTFIAVLFFLLIGFQGNHFVGLDLLDEKPELFYGSLFALSLIVSLLDCKGKRSIGNSYQVVITICMGFSAIQPSHAILVSMIALGFLIWNILLGLNQNKIFIPIMAFLILFTLLEPKNALLKGNSPIIGYLSNDFGFSLNSSTYITQIFTTVLISIFVVQLLKVSLHFSQDQSSYQGIFPDLTQLASKKNVYFTHSLSVFLPFIVLLSISYLEFQISFSMSYESLTFGLNTITHSQYIDTIITSLITVSIKCVAIAYAVKPPVKLHPSKENKKSKKSYEMIKETPFKIIDSSMVLEQSSQQDA